MYQQSASFRYKLSPTYVIDLGLYDDDVKIEIGLEDINYVGFYLGFINYDDIMNLSSNVSKVEKVNNGYNINVSNDLGYNKIGRWWNNTEEIDIVDINEDTKDILFGECKYSNSIRESRGVGAIELF